MTCSVCRITLIHAAARLASCRVSSMRFGSVLISSKLSEQEMLMQVSSINNGNIFFIAVMVFIFF